MKHNPQRRLAGALAVLAFGMVPTATFAASDYIYGIHWYGDHNVTEVEEMTGGKGIWVLEIILTEDTGQWSLAQQMPKFQAIVARGHTLIIRIQPRWSLVVPGDDTAGSVGDRMSTFLTKVTQAAQQLSNLCHIWQTGNEMNLGFEYDIGNLTPALYVQKYKQIRAAIKSVNSSLGEQIVLLGPVAPVDNGYLGSMLDNLTASEFDAFAMHAYGGALGSFRNMYRDQLNFIDSRGYQDKAVYITEWGAPTNPVSDTVEAGVAGFLKNEFIELGNWNAGAGNHDVVCAIWFVYARDSFWINWSIRSLRDLHPRGVDKDLWDAFQSAATLNIPAGEGAGSGGGPGPGPNCTAEPVVNGDFGFGGSNWTNWTERGSATVNYSSSQTPAGGSAPCVQISSTGNFNGGAYQTLSLVAGQNYTVRTLARDVGSTAGKAWQEILVGVTQPSNGSDYTNGLRLKWDTINCPGWNGNESTACVTQQASFTASASTMYLVLKCGQDGSPGANVNVSYDNVSLCGGGGGNPGNNPPTAVANGNPLSGNAPLNVSFNANGSSDPDSGQTLTYSWNFGDGSNGSGLSTSHTYNSNGTYNVVLTVNDGNGGTDTANLTVTVGSGGGGTPVDAIKNPNFQDNNGPFGVAKDWASFGGNKWESAFDGGRSWVQGVSELAVNNGIGGVRQTFAVTSGKQYRLTVSSRVTHADLDAAIGVSPTGGTDGGSASYGTPTNQTGWTDITVEFTAQSSTATVFLRGRNPKPFPVVGGWAFFDGVTLEDLGGGGGPGGPNCTQEPVSNGDFSAGGSGWTNWTERGSATRNFSSSQTPTGGSTPALQISSTGNFNGGVYQTLNLTAGNTYSVKVVARDVGSTAGKAWQEIHVGATQPTNGQDYNNGLRLKWDTITCPGWNGNETSACITQQASFTASAATMYLVLKCGQDGTAGANVNVSFDNISLCAGGGGGPGDDCDSEPVVNGDFQVGNANWTNWTERGSATRNFSSTVSVSGGATPALQISSTGNFNGGVYQTLSLESGTEYTLKCVARDFGSTAGKAWQEILVGTTQPIASQDYNDGLRLKWDTINCPGWNGDQSSACVTQQATFTASASTMYLVLKCGQDGTAGANVNVVFDSITLCDGGGGPGGGCDNEPVVNGDFSAGSGNWINWAERGSAIRNFNSINTPSGGTAPALQIGANGSFNGGVYQVLSLVAGQEYSVQAVARDLGSTADKAWQEILVGTTQPINGQDYGNGLRLKWDTETCPGWNGDETSACVTQQATFTATAATMYLVLKCGQDGSSAIVNVSFDDISLCVDDGPPGGDCTEPVSNGSFVSGNSGWTTWTERGSVTRNFSSSTCPTGAVGNCLRMTSSGSFNGGVWQQLSLVAGTTYQLRVVGADLGSTAGDGWQEVLIGPVQPVNGQDYAKENEPGGGGIVGVRELVKWDIQTCSGWDGDQTTACATQMLSFTATSTSMYLVLKCGQDGGGGNIDVAFDEVTLCPPGAGGGLTLTTSACVGGSIIEPALSPSNHNNGETVNITAQADAGYYFTGWTGDGVDDLADRFAASTTITLSGDADLMATFSPTAAIKIQNNHFANGLTNWNNWTVNGSVTPQESAGALNISGASFNGGVYQQFSTGGPGNIVTVTGYWASLPTTVTALTAEVIVINGSRTPTNGVNETDGGDTTVLYRNTTKAGWDGPMSKTAPGKHQVSFVSSGSTATIILRVNTTGAGLADVLFDNIEVRCVPSPATVNGLSSAFTSRSFTFSESSLVSMAQSPVSRLIYAVRNNQFGGNSNLYRINIGGGSINATVISSLPQVICAQGLTFDPAGNIYLSTREGDIFKGTDTNASPTVDSFSFTQIIDLPQQELGTFHGVGGIAVGPDGMLYINSGSESHYGFLSNGTPELFAGRLNARILRASTNGGLGTVETFCEGVRNTFDITFRSDGKLFGVENGPNTNCNYAEEFNMLREGRHYGFPYRFASDIDGGNASFTCNNGPGGGVNGPPPLPGGLQTTHAWANYGPFAKPGAGQTGYQDGQAYYGFHPHSSPTGVCFYEPAAMDPAAPKFPAEFHGRAFVARFGQLEGGIADVGFDVLSMRLDDAGVGYVCNGFLTGVGRAIDTLCAYNGRLYVLVFSSDVGGTGLGGNSRIIEIASTAEVGPAIALSTNAINRTAQIGVNLSSDTFTVANAGTGTLVYSIQDNQSWLSVSPTAGSSTGEPDSIAINYSTAGLGFGQHVATITVSDPNASNNPQTITVTVSVQALVTVPPDFDKDGDVDQSDWGVMQACLSQTIGDFPPPGCEAARLDADVDVDQNDVGIFLFCFGGANVPVTQECRDLFP